MGIIVLVIVIVFIICMIISWIIHKSLGHTKDYSQRGGYNYPYSWSGSSGSLLRDIQEANAPSKSGQVVIIDGKVWKYRDIGEDQKSGPHYKFRNFDESMRLNYPKKLSNNITWTGIHVDDWKYEDFKEYNIDAKLYVEQKHKN